jgi:hypothetical protein
VDFPASGDRPGGHSTWLRIAEPPGSRAAPDRGDPITTPRGRCAEAHLGCPCRGDETIHQERARELTEARARSQEPVDCPECGSPTTPLALVTWGNCRVCRTAQSRQITPLRW